MRRPDASAERMVAVTKRYGLSVVLVLSALLVTHFFLPPKYTLRFNPAELPELLAFFVLAVVVSAWSALVTRLDPSRANRPVSPDAVALTH